MLLYKAVILSVLLSSSLVQANNWRLDKNQEGIKIFTRVVSGSKVRAFKAEIWVPASLERVLAVYADFPNFPKWIYNNGKAVLLKSINKNEYYHYQDIKMPFPVKNRDMVIHSKIINRKGSVVISTTSGHKICGTLVKCRKLRQSNHVHIKKLSGTFVFKPYKKGVNLVWKQHVELAGSLPSWLVNRLLLDVPYHTLTNLKQRVKLKKYQQ